MKGEEFQMKRDYYSRRTPVNSKSLKKSGLDKFLTIFQVAVAAANVFVLLYLGARNIDISVENKNSASLQALVASSELKIKEYEHEMKKLELFEKLNQVIISAGSDIQRATQDERIGRRCSELVLKIIRSDHTGKFTSLFSYQIDASRYPIKLLAKSGEEIMNLMSSCSKDKSLLVDDGHPDYLSNKEVASFLGDYLDVYYNVYDAGMKRIMLVGRMLSVLDPKYFDKRLACEYIEPDIYLLEISEKIAGAGGGAGQGIIGLGCSGPGWMQPNSPTP